MTTAQIRGLPVVTVLGGDDVAEVRDVIYSPAHGAVMALTLNRRGFLAGRRKELLPSSSVHAIGQHAVMVMDEQALMPRDEARADVAGAGGDRDVLGNDVLTERGVSLGVVRDLVVLAGTSGAVVGYQVSKPGGGEAFIPLPAQLSVSGKALVVPDLTEEFVRDDLVGLGAAVDEFRGRLGLR